MHRNLNGEDKLQDPDKVPSRLTAREFTARDPAAKEKDPDPRAGERHASASFADDRDSGEPMITPQDPPRGRRGLPVNRIEGTLHKRQK